MFTGIVEEMGRIGLVDRGTKSAVLSINAIKTLEDAKVGDSIAVNGVCLTVTSFNNGGFVADVMKETLERSTFSKLKVGSRVNLERAMAANGRFGGHMVSGHIDGMGSISAIKKEGNAIWFTIQASPDIMKYIIEKGSVAIDGISLTVARVNAGSFSVSAIPHTVESTILREKKLGDLVNLENDMVGKYMEKFLMTSQEDNTVKSGITMDMLSKLGY